MGRAHDLTGERAASRLRHGARALPVGPRFVSERPRDGLRIGVVHNVRARHNIDRPVIGFIDRTEFAAPRSPQELDDVLAGFASRGVNALVIDGGDGTVRDVMSKAGRHFEGTFPRVAIVPSGKTNALAHDLGVPRHWTAHDAVQAIHDGVVEERAPIEIRRDQTIVPDLRGFIFGAGAFVRATALAQRTHRVGAFNGLAVGLSIAGAVGQTILGGANNSWRQGEPMRVALADGTVVDRNQYLLFGSTLERLPLGIKPLGEPRPGLKLLRIDASPRWMVAAAPAVLRGSAAPWLRDAGYHIEDSARIDLHLGGDFILDGETFQGGALSLRQGEPIRFVVP